MTTTNIDLKHIARVEGYGRLKVNIEDKRVTSATFNVLEGARFFEGITLGKKFNEVPIIVSRICAICSHSHSVVATRAVENAVGIKPSQQTHDIRKMMVWGETLQSHVLHAYFLAVPDYLRKPSAIAMAASHPDLVKRAFYHKRIANEIQRKVGGRAVHPIRNVVGGITMFPTTEEMIELKNHLPTIIEETIDTIKIFKTLHDQHVVVDDKEKDYVAIHDTNEYNYYDSEYITSGHSEPFLSKDYQKHLIEEIRPYSHTKFSTINGKSFMVGALARLNLNNRLLTPKAKEALEFSGLQLPDYNTYAINMAQLIECVDVSERMLNIFNQYIANGFEAENIDDILKDARPGNGTAATEAPRGLLIHQYTFDEDMRCKYTDIITPTAFNQFKMETDCNNLVPKIAHQSKEDIELFLNMLIRAYDPCISCSAHALLDVEFE